MGANMLQFVLLNQSALERSDNLLTWVQSWAPPSGLRVLKPLDWYELGHGLIGGTNNLDNIWTPQYSQKCNLWVLPLAVVGDAMEEQIRSRHMNPHVPHIFICPRLMTYGWRKSLVKTADTIFLCSTRKQTFLAERNA